MRTYIQTSPAYQLAIDLEAAPHGHSLRLTSLVPEARRPERQVKFQGFFTTDELRALHAAIGQAIADGAASA